MRSFLAALTMASLIISPAAASVRDAALSTASDRPAAQTSMFAGATYRIGFDRRTHEPRGRASLKLSGMATAPGSSTIRFGDGLEISGGQSGKPALHLAGRDLGQLKSKAELSGSGTALIIGGIVVLAVVVVLVASDAHHDNKCSEEEDC